VTLVALVAGAGGCARAAASPGEAGVAVAAGSDHACIVPGSGHPTVAWSRLADPIVSEPAAGVKDQALIWAGGRWHMLFSEVTDDSALPGGVRWNIATATSTDLAHWTSPVPWPAQAAVVGVASPDIVRSPTGTFVVTYDSGPGQQGGGEPKLYYRTSKNLETWSAPRSLAANLGPAPTDRMIDPALAWTGHGLILGYKAGATAQHFEVAWSPRGTLSGPWRPVGRPDISLYGDTVENYEFLTLGGRWHLVATSNTFDQPWLFTLAGDPRHAASWLHWTGARQLRIPSRPWDSGPGLSSVSYEHANSVFLCDARAGGGYYYATYAGSDELTAFDGWGHAKIGIARSTDLVHWQVPG
jgi:hypothetical protein